MNRLAAKNTILGPKACTHNNFLKCQRSLIYGLNFTEISTFNDNILFLENSVFYDKFDCHLKKIFFDVCNDGI